MLEPSDRPNAIVRRSARDLPSMTASGLRREAAKRRLVIEPALGLEPATRWAPVVGSQCIVFAKSRQFDHTSTALWCTVAVRADPRRLTGSAHPTEERSRPTAIGRIKAAGCGPVGRVKQVGISAPWHEVHFAREPVFSDNARKTNAWRTSRAAAWSMSAVTAGRSVTPRILRPFGSSQVWWHTAAMACPHQSRQFTRQLRRSASGLASGPGRKK
jgi:hypothetical protein